MACQSHLQLTSHQRKKTKLHYDNEDKAELQERKSVEKFTFFVVTK